MADERIDITINDKIDPSIAKNLDAIAKGATTGHSAVQRLKRELAAINDTPTRKLAAATDEVTNAVNRELNAQRSVKAARDSSTASLNREASQRDRIAAMVDRSIAKLEAEAAARNRLASSMNEPRFAGSRSTVEAQNAQMAQQATDALTAARQRDAAAARVQEAATEASSNAMRRNAAAAGLNRQQMLNLGFQLQDIVVALQAGQNPLTVFIQQGGQIGQIAAQAGIGIRGMTMAIWGAIAPFAPWIAAIAAVVAAWKVFQDNINDSAGLKEYAKTLGLTKQEMKGLEDVTVTTGDMFKGLWKVISDRTGVDESITSFKDWFVSEFWKAVDAGIDAISQLYGTVVGSYRAIKKVWADLPAMLGTTFAQGVNFAIAHIEALTNAAIKGVNAMARGANAVLEKVGVGAIFGQIGEVQLQRVKTQTNMTAKEVAGIFKAEVNAATAEAKAGIKNFAADWKKASQQAARDRLKAQADAIKADRPDKKGPKGKEDNSAEKRAHALDMVNLKLDQELSRMKLLKDERAIQQRMDQIEAEFAQKKIKLSDAERTAILGKVKAIEEYKYVQSELDRIYEDSVAPQRTYNSTLQAAKELLDKGAISATKYANEVAMASRKLAEATDPLFAMKEAMGQAEAATKLYGVAAQQAAYYEQIRQAYLAKNIPLSAQYVAGVNAEVDALMRRNAALQQQQFIQQTVGEILNPMLQDQMLLDNKAALYAEIERFRQMDVRNEEMAQRAKYALDAKFNQMRLQGASQFFGTLAGLSSSGNKKLAAIGKAAAIAQTTIDGIVAVQKALASGPPPWNMINAAAIAAMTGANVAKIISTPVGSFQNGGDFIVDGKAGVDNNNISMNVSRGERVKIETPAQQRANESAASGAPPEVNVKSVVLFDPRNMLDVMETSEGERVFMQIVERRAGEIARMLG